MATTVNSLDATIAFATRDPQKALASRAQAAGDIKMIEVASGPFEALNRISQPHITFNLQGFGSSVVHSGKEQSRGYGLSLYMSDFDAVYGAAGISSTVLCGYTRAGYFAVKYAVTCPEKVKALILVEPGLFTDSEELLRRAQLAQSGDAKGSLRTMLSYIAPHPYNDAATAVKSANDILANLQPGKENLILANEFLVRANNPVTERDLESLTMPVLLIAGTESHVKDMISRAAAAIPQASVWWVRGANIIDLVRTTYADEIAKVIDLFLAKHS